jgi:hypothetical protein
MTVVRLITKIREEDVPRARCFYLTENCELHVMAKMRQRAKEPEKQETEVKEDQNQENEGKAAPQTLKLLKLIDSEQEQGNMGILNLFNDSQIDDIDTSDTPMSDGSLVKLRFWPKPRLSDYDFKEYLSLKQNKVGIKLGSDHGYEAFFRVRRTTKPATFAQGSFAYNSLLPVTTSSDYFHSTETVSISYVDSIHEMDSKTNVYASFKCTNNLIR